MKKEHKIAIIIVAVLVVVLGVALFLNKDLMTNNKETFENVELNIIENGNEIGKISYDELIDLEAKEFTATYDTSKTDPVIENYKGVELKKVFEHFGISLEGKSTVILTAVDNFTIAYSVDEVMKDENVFVTFEIEGEAISSKENGGSGPLVAIVADDMFSNRRCKWMISAEVIE